MEQEVWYMFLCRQDFVTEGKKKEVSNCRSDELGEEKVKEMLQRLLRKGKNNLYLTEE